MKKVPQEEINYGYGNPYEIIGVTKRVVDGRVTKFNEPSVYNPCEAMARYDARDFALENIIEAGAVGELRNSYYNATPIESSDKIDSDLAILDVVDLNNNVNNDEE